MLRDTKNSHSNCLSALIRGALAKIQEIFFSFQIKHLQSPTDDIE